MRFHLPLLRSAYFPEASGNHRNLHRVLHLLVHHRAENNIGIFMRRALDDGASLLHLGQLQ